VSWQLGAFAVLALALAGGFVWYERTRPDARIVALVGTLAAFAALGRIAFAPLPNVKPTTDIVLITGYALGGAPGFVVGALAGLTSNFFFGQGPWTPWQMAAWGTVGLIGALLALATHGRIGRIRLAVLCGAAGFLFTAVQDVGDWVTYSDHSSASLRVYVAKGIGFDTVHAVGCVLFALAFGPALLHSIQRFARRLNVTWEPAPGAVCAAIALTLAATLAGTPVGARAAPARTPASYLLGAQNADGGFGSAPNSSSTQLFSGWAVLGLAAAGHNPQDVRHGGASALAYIASGAGSLSDPGSLERTILAVRAAGRSIRSFSGHDLLAALERDFRRDGSISDQVNLTSFAVLALRAAGTSPPPAMWRWLIRQQDEDGGFSFSTGGSTSDVDDTAATLQALSSAGSVAAHSRARAVGFIRAAQNRDGGFPSEPGGDSNAQSTAWAVQGLLSARVDPGSLHRHGAVSPVQYLRSLIRSDGHVSYSRGNDQSPVWVTAEALMALAGKPLPLAPVPLAAVPRVAQAPVRPAAAPPRQASHHAVPQTVPQPVPVTKPSPKAGKVHPAPHQALRAAPPRAAAPVQTPPDLGSLGVLIAIITAVALALIGAA
jgi:energy-coupling factor transport system substrate-specific component